MWHHPAVLKDMMGFGRKAEKWDELDRNLASLADMAAAGDRRLQLLPRPQLLHGAQRRPRRGEGAARCRAGASRRVFTPLERHVMEYAEAMSQTPPAVTDELSAALLDELGAPALLELTAQGRDHEHVRAHEHRARHPLARGSPTSCGLPPLAAGVATAGVAAAGVALARHDRRPVRHPPRPALHGRVRDARLRGRRRGRAAGVLAAVGRRRPRARCAIRARTSCGS